MLLIENTDPINKVAIKEAWVSLALGLQEASWRLSSSTWLPLYWPLPFLSLCPRSLTFFLLFIVSRKDQPPLFPEAFLWTGEMVQPVEHMHGN